MYTFGLICFHKSLINLIILWAFFAIRTFLTLSLCLSHLFILISFFFQSFTLITFSLTPYANIYTAMRFELATRRVTSPDSEIFTPFELQVNFTQKMLALPYQKYTFSERKFDEKFKYGFENKVGWGTNILWLKIFGFCGPQNQIISENHISFPYYQIYFSSAYLVSSSNFLSENV